MYTRSWISACFRAELDRIAADCSNLRVNLSLDRDMVEKHGLPARVAGKADSVIDVSEHQPRRIPSPKWRELIKKVWEADPLLCPKCLQEMRIVALIDEREVIERILRHLGLWQEGVCVESGPDPLGDWVIEPCFDDAAPDYDTDLDLACANE